MPPLAGSCDLPSTSTGESSGGTPATRCSYPHKTPEAAMNKVKLNMDALQVDTFDLGTDARREGVAP
ncbi:MAG TPA: hypothetical protein VF705_14950, partial [Longimicrobium sp.]